MVTKRIRVLIALSLTLTLVSGSSIAFARGGADDTTTVNSSSSTPTSTSTSESGSSSNSGSRSSTSGRSSTETEVEVHNSTSSSLSDDVKKEVEKRETEIKDRVETKKSEVKEKLANKRLETCQKRQAQINSIIQKSNDHSQKHLAVFEKIEARVKAFYEDKKLNVANFDTLVANVDIKHAAAVAEVNVASTTSFSCDNTDATNPGSVVKDLMNSKNDAIKEYRTALKDLIVAIKGASSSTSDNSTETEAN